MTTSLHSAVRALAHRGKYARASIGTTGTERYSSLCNNDTEPFSVPMYWESYQVAEGRGRWIAGRIGLHCQSEEEIG